MRYLIYIFFATAYAVCVLSKHFCTSNYTAMNCPMFARENATVVQKHALLISGTVAGKGFNLNNLISKLIRPNNMDVYVNLAVKDDFGSKQQLKEHLMTYSFVKKMNIFGKEHETSIETIMQTFPTFPWCDKNQEQCRRNRHRFKGPINSFKMFQNLAKVSSLLHEFEIEHDFHYDTVTRVRPDLAFKYPLNLTEIVRDNSTIYTTKCGAFNHGINDNFQAGSSRIMQVLGMVFDDMTSLYVNNTKLIGYPERLLYQVLINRHVSIGGIDLPQCCFAIPTSNPPNKMMESRYCQLNTDWIEIGTEKH